MALQTSLTPEENQLRLAIADAYLQLQSCLIDARHGIRTGGGSVTLSGALWMNSASREAGGRPVQELNFRQAIKPEQLSAAQAVVDQILPTILNSGADIPTFIGLLGATLGYTHLKSLPDYQAATDV